MADTYQLLQTAAGLAIRCLLCGRVSYNRYDIAERYCGACHRFHDDPHPERRP